MLEDQEALVLMILMDIQWITKFQILELTKIFSTHKDIWKKLLNYLERNHGMDMDGIPFMYSLRKILKENHFLLEDLFQLPH